MASELALYGGTPVRRTLLPYGRQSVADADIEAAASVLRSDWLTTGPAVASFEESVAEYVGTAAAVAVSSGTAALHAAMFALGIRAGDEVIVPTMTFAATANCVVYQGGTPVFADVEADTLLLLPESVEARITRRTKAIVAVDYGGQPADYDALRRIAQTRDLLLVDDAAHALGARYKGRSAGALADLNCFSFHPVKHVTTGEGGMITTNAADFAAQMRVFRNHGITTGHRERSELGQFAYEMVDLGYNYRLTDFQCALGRSQLERLPQFLEARRKIAKQYDGAFAGAGAVRPLKVHPDREHAYHLYPVLLDLDQLTVDREVVFAALRAEGIGVNVHYMPVHLHPFYRNRFSTAVGMCPVAEAAYGGLLSLPIFPTMTSTDVADVIVATQKVVGAFAR